MFYIIQLLLLTNNSTFATHKDMFFFIVIFLD